jgi:hypothetical protein
MVKALFSCAVAVALSACPQQPPNVPDASGPGGAPGAGGTVVVDADTPPPAPVWDTSDVCGSTEARANFVGCTPVRPEAGTWAAACRNARGHGLVFLVVECARQATTRERMSQCGVTCAP